MVGWRIPGPLSLWRYGRRTALSSLLLKQRNGGKNRSTNSISSERQRRLCELVLPGRTRESSCICPADFTTTGERWTRWTAGLASDDGEEMHITIVSYHQLGYSRSPSDWMWTAIAMPPSQSYCHIWLGLFSNTYYARGESRGARV